jgi:hypothetical protein
MISKATGWWLLLCKKMFVEESLQTLDLERLL